MIVCVFFGAFARIDMPGDIIGGASFMAYFPFFADIEGTEQLVAGDGGVALRRMQDLFPYGAITEVISPDMCPSPNVLVRDNVYTDVFELTRKEFGDRDLDGADSAIAVTSESGLSSRTPALCCSKRIPVNVMDVKEECSFIFPSIMQGDPVVMGISTGDMSPAIARYLKARIQSIMPGSLEDPTAQPGSYRKVAKDLFPDLSQVRSALFYELTGEGLGHDDYLTQEQARTVINGKLEQRHK